MNFNKLIYALVVGVSLILLLQSTGCKDECNTVYELRTDVNITPAQDTNRIGDTITWTFRAPVNTINRITGKLETISKFDVGLEISIQKLDGLPPGRIQPLPNTYEYIRVVEKSDDVRLDFLPNSIYVKPQLVDSFYTSEFKFIFEQPGVYSSIINGFTDDDVFFSGENLKDEIIIKDGCQDTFFGLFMPVNNRVGTRPELYCEFITEPCENGNVLANLDKGYHKNGVNVFEITE